MKLIKNLYQKSRLPFVVACNVALGIFIINLLATRHAHAQSGQGWPTTQTVLTTSTNTVVGSGTINTAVTGTITSQAFTPNASKGFGVWASLIKTGTDSSSVTLQFQTALSGTGPWTNTVSETVSLSGSAANLSYTGFTPQGSPGAVAVSGSIALSGSTSGPFTLPAVPAVPGVANMPYLRLGSVISTGSGTLTLSNITIVTSNSP
jgi:hypothetical protein